MSASTDRLNKEKAFDKESWAEHKKAERRDAYALIDEGSMRVAGDVEALKRFLDVQSRFSRYSVSNALLISEQKPDATRIGSYDYWRTQDTSINKGQQSIVILEPGDEYRRDDGSIGVSYNTKRVFDISQTTKRRELSPEIKVDERTLTEALIMNAPARVQIQSDVQLNAIYSPPDKTIYVRKGMSGAEIFRSLATEMAHAELADGDEGYRREHHALHANCAAYILCKQNGIAPSEDYFRVPPVELALLEPQQIREELGIIRNTANDISARMEERLKHVSQDRPPKQGEKEQR